MRRAAYPSLSQSPQIALLTRMPEATTRSPTRERIPYSSGSVFIPRSVNLNRRGERARTGVGRVRSQLLAADRTRIASRRNRTAPRFTQRRRLPKPLGHYAHITRAAAAYNGCPLPRCHGGSRKPPFPPRPAAVGRQVNHEFPTTGRSLAAPVGLFAVHFARACGNRAPRGDGA